jgi:hypothetical protein
VLQVAREGVVVAPDQEFDDVSIEKRILEVQNDVDPVFNAQFKFPTSVSTKQVNQP